MIFIIIYIVASTKFEVLIKVDARMTNEQFQIIVLDQFAELKSKVSTIKSDMGTKKQQDETLQIVKAIQHNSEVLNAAIH